MDEPRPHAPTHEDQGGRLVTTNNDTPRIFSDGASADSDSDSDSGTFGREWRGEPDAAWFGWEEQSEPADGHPQPSFDVADEGYPGEPETPQYPGYPEVPGYPREPEYPSGPGYAPLPPDHAGYPAGPGYVPDSGHAHDLGYPHEGWYEPASGYPRDPGYPPHAGYPRDPGYPPAPGQGAWSVRNSVGAWPAASSDSIGGLPSGSRP